MIVKKLLITCFVFVISIGAMAFFSPKKEKEEISSKAYCAFCDSAVLKSQVFYEDELVLALYTHKPVFPGHCLVIPKRHVEHFDLLLQDEANQINQTIKKVHGAANKIFGTSSYLLLQKNGAEVGQNVPHVHFHYIPRKSGDLSSLKFIAKMFLADAKKPISSSAMGEMVEKFQAELAQE